MQRRARSLPLALVGLAVMLVGLAGAVVLFLQPWRACPEDDSAAGCPVTELDGYLMLGAMGLFLIGAIVMVASLLPRRITRGS